jgi:Temperature dependent protein affecting M2 dsRNA replication
LQYTQLKYFESAPKPFIDFVWGSTDVLLFDVEKVILKLDLDASQFFWVSKENCKEELGRLTSEQFLDFGLLLGSRFLRTFPPFENSNFPGKPWNIRDALNIFNNANRQATTLCSQFEEDRRVQDLQYLDRYKRAYMSIKHHVITDPEGRVGPLDLETAPSDVHELIGQRLPEELYYYISRGTIGSNIPNCLTSGQLTVSLPFGVEDSDVYRHLTGDLLMPIREQAICLLSNGLHRFYQTKVINVRLWYEENPDRTMNLKTLPSVRDTLRSWRISHKQLPSELANLEVCYFRLTTSC